MRELFHKAIDQLPNSARELFWGLSSHEIEQETEEGVASVKGKVDEVMGRLNTNTFGEEFGDEEEYSLVVPETAVCPPFCICKEPFLSILCGADFWCGAEIES